MQERTLKLFAPIFGMLKQFGLRPTLQNAGVFLFFSLDINEEKDTFLFKTVRGARSVPSSQAACAGHGRNLLFCF